MRHNVEHWTLLGEERWALRVHRKKLWLWVSIADWLCCPINLEHNDYPMSLQQNKKHQHFTVPLRDEREAHREITAALRPPQQRAPIATELIVKTAVREREDVGEAWRAEKRFKYEIITFSRDSVCPSFAFTRATHYTRYMQVHTSTCGEADWSDAWSEH